MKSVETRFAEAMDALKKAGRTKQFNEKVKGCTTIEAKLNCAEAVLQDVGVVREAIRKHNGASDNFSETNPFRPVEEFRESANNFSPGYIKEVTDPCAKGDKILFEALGIPMPGGKPEGYEKLNEGQKKEFDFARLIGLSEADAFKLVRITGGYK
ncbi:MAG: hypothetical protein ACM3WP_02000 [Acidobacteriota bacterium]